MEPKIFSHKQKKLLAKKISDIEKKHHILNICEIIKNDSSHKEVTENNNGVFMHFQNLNNETYIKIEQYIENISITNASSTPLSSDDVYTPYSYDEYNIQPNSSSKIKYSNKEKNIIKRKRYDQLLEDSS